MRYFTPIRLSENMRETPEGFLVCLDVPIARTGWQVYAAGEIPLTPGPDGKIEVYRDPEEVFSEETIASFEGKAFTIEHPMDFVDPSNWKELAKGVLQNVRRGNGKDQDGEESLLSDILVTDLVAIQLIKNGLREVSCGYEAIYEQTSVGKGRQTKIIGNHLALVREGRAGPGYAIHDHKTEGLTKMSKLAEKVKNLFSKAAEEAVAELTKDEKADEKKKDEKTKDDEGKVEQKADGSVSYDELVKIVKDMAEKVNGLSTSKDAEVEEKEETGDVEVSPALEERLKKIEAFISKLMEMEAKEQSGDEGTEEVEEVGDESEEDNSKTGDTAARAEILSPGIKITKDVKAKALKAAYGTKDGKEVINSLTGNKAPSFDSAEHVSNLFIAASEVLKAKRGVGLEGTKNPKTFDSASRQHEEMTAEKMNEINKAFYSQK